MCTVTKCIIAIVNGSFCYKMYYHYYYNPQDSTELNIWTACIPLCMYMYLMNYLHTITVNGQDTQCNGTVHIAMPIT